MVIRKHILPLLLTLTLLLPWIGGMLPAELEAKAAGEVYYGVDVSSYNGNVDWPLLAGNGISFVILRGGKLPSEKEKYFEDDQFDKNYRAARNVGLKVGVYMRCGATSWEKFEAAVNSYIETLDGKAFDYPVFLDVEEAAQEKLGKEVMTQYVLDGLAMLREAGYNAGSYANLNWYTNYLDGDAIKAEGYELWLARYTHDSSSNDFSDRYCMWQYSNKGNLAGNGSSAIDLDVSYVDFDFHPELRLEKDASYDSILPLHAYMCQDESFTPRYADCETEMAIRDVPASTECLIHEIYTNGWCRFAYYVNGERRVGYLPFNCFMDKQLPVPMEERSAPGEILTYTRSDLAQSSGKIGRRTLCRVVQETDNAVELIYPTADGFKLGWVGKSDWEVGYLMLLQDHVHGCEYLTESELIRVDCNRDGEADVFDLGLMRRNLLSQGHAKPDTQYSIVEQHLANMTLQEKVYQLLIVTPESLTGNTAAAVTASDEATKAALLERPVGGIVYFAQNLKDGAQTKSMIDGAQTYAKETHGTGLWIAVDEEGGSVARVAERLGTTAYDSMAVYGAKGDAAAVYSIGEDIAADISQFGFNLNFAPVADVKISETNELGDRIFSSDPAVVSSMSAAMVQGLQSSGKVSGTLKHFPGLGAADGNTHKDAATRIDRTYEQLQAEEFSAFRGGIDAGVDFVMVGHQIMSCAGDDLPSDLSHVVMTDWLRGELGYKGIIVTDAHNMNTITASYSAGEAAKMAIKAGADVILMPDDVDAAFAGIYKAVRSGEIPESRIDESIRRILRAKEKHGLIG